MKPNDAICIRVVKQRHSMDCLLCCLAMLLGSSYEATLLAVSKVRTDSATEGMYWTEAIAAAELLGARLKVKKRYDANDSVGIVSLSKKGQPNQHAALLLRGTLIDPEGPDVWDDFELFEQATGWKVGTLLTHKKKQK